MQVARAEDRLAKVKAKESAQKTRASDDASDQSETETDAGDSSYSSDGDSQHRATIARCTKKIKRAEQALARKKKSSSKQATEAKNGKRG